MYTEAEELCAVLASRVPQLEFQYREEATNILLLRCLLYDRDKRAKIKLFTPRPMKSVVPAWPRRQQTAEKAVRSTHTA